MVKLAECYEKGLGVQANLAEAERLLRLAVDLKEPSAARRLRRLRHGGER
jgi:TPR repeat protein